MAETKTVRPIAMGVGAIRIADVGDGVPGTDFTTLPLPTKSSVAFNFADPKEVKIEKIPLIILSSLFLLQVMIQ